jgi:ubiquitin C-terminal hydrolase
MVIRSEIESARGSSLSITQLISGVLFIGSVLIAGVYFYATTTSIRKKKRINTNGNIIIDSCTDDCISSDNRSIVGLNNTSNTCYANALLQGLASLPSFVAWIDQLDVHQMSFLHALQSTINSNISLKLK